MPNTLPKPSKGPDMSFLAKVAKGPFLENTPKEEIRKIIENNICLRGRQLSIGEVGISKILGIIERERIKEWSKHVKP